MINLNKNNNTSYNKPLIAVFLITFTVLLLNTPILTTLWRHSFDDGTYSHAYLIPFISIYLFYILQKSEKLAFRGGLSFPAIFIFVSSCVSLYLTSKAQISLGYWCSLIAVLGASINMIFKLNKHIVFPSAFLIFIMPVWGMFTNVLQEISVNVVTFFMSLTGVPTYVEGNFVTIPAGVFEIADGCSGLRYMIVSLAISSLFSFLYINNTKKALSFFALAIFGALLTNWLRITALILIGEYTNMESSLMEDHNTFGWYLFIPFMFILFWWGNKVADIDLTSKQTNSLTEKTTHSDQARKTNNINKPALAILLLVLFGSSTALNSLMIAAPSAHELTSDTNLEIKPTIHFYSYLTSNTDSKTNITESTYYFNGKDLDGKPSYYENNFIPNGWNLIAQESISNQNTYRAYNNSKTALILVNYEINQQLFSSLTAFKIARLTMAIKNINQSKLHWKFIPCKQYSCKAELQNLEDDIIN